MILKYNAHSLAGKFSFSAKLSKERPPWADLTRWQRVPKFM